MTRARPEAAEQVAAGIDDAAAGRRRGRLVRAVNDLKRLVEATERIIEQARQRIGGSAERVDPHPTRLDGDETQRGVEDQPGETHATDGRPEQRSVVARPDHRGGTIGEHHRDRVEVVADRSVDVVVLAVNVAGDGTADRHETAFPA